MAFAEDIYPDINIIGPLEFEIAYNGVHRIPNRGGSEGSWHHSICPRHHINEHRWWIGKRTEKKKTKTKLWNSTVTLISIVDSEI